MVNEMRLPSPILYGVGSFAELGRQTRAYGVKALIVSDPVMEKLGRIDECRRLLKEAGLDVAVYSDVDREPTDRHVDEALKVESGKLRCRRGHRGRQRHRCSQGGGCHAHQRRIYRRLHGRPAHVQTCAAAVDRRADNGGDRIGSDESDRHY